MTTKKRTRTAGEEKTRPSSAADVADRFDTDLTALIRVAEDRFGKTGNEDWADVTVRLERVRSIVREMMTERARKAIKWYAEIGTIIPI